MKFMRRKKQQFFLRYILAALGMFTVFFLGMHILFAPRVSLHVLRPLTIPTQPVVYLPEPYIARVLTTSVLGAQTINPEDVIIYINDERMKRSAPPLRENATLDKAAAMRTAVIFKYQNFSHQDPNSHIQLDTVLPMLGYPFTYASENIGMGNSSAEEIVGGFMSSTSHRINLLNPALRETGVSVVYGEYQGYWVNVTVELFAIPATRDQYLGYGQEDVTNYKNFLTDVQSQIALTKDKLTNHVGDQEYYAGWQKILIRQEEILTTLYNTMLSQQPLVNNLITLMTEYNNNWNLVPKS